MSSSTRFHFRAECDSAHKYGGGSLESQVTLRCGAVGDINWLLGPPFGCPFGWPDQILCQCGHLARIAKKPGPMPFQRLQIGAVIVGSSTLASHLVLFSGCFIRSAFCNQIYVISRHFSVRQPREKFKVAGSKIAKGMVTDISAP